jgi:ABC-2 type transport system permease protein
MTTESNAAYQPSLGADRTESPFGPATASFYWSVRRELWENRSITLGAPAVAALILVGIVINQIRLMHHVQASAAPNSLQPLSLVQHLNVAALAIMATTFLVAIFYCLDALHGERRDRSILFWKSLPVSDLTTVLSKATIPVVILPLITFATTVLTQWMILIISSVILRAQGISIAPLWNGSSMFGMSVMLLFHLVAIHGLWYAPIYCWLLLVSAWARRAPFLWAVVPILGIALVEKIAFGTSFLGRAIGNRVSGGSGSLAIAAAFLAGAVQLRRYRGPI